MELSRVAVVICRATERDCRWLCKSPRFATHDETHKIDAAVASLASLTFTESVLLSVSKQFGRLEHLHYNCPKW